jgi:hypothetical protein
MNRLRLLIPLFLPSILLGMMACMAGGSPPPPPNGSNTVLPKAGDYLAEDYLAKVRKEHSSFQAWILNAPQMVYVGESRGGRILSSTINFHEGGSEFFLDRAGKLSVKESAGEAIPPLVFEVDSTERFNLGYGKTVPQTYVFVGSAEKAIGAILLVGKYRDDLGREYIIHEDGRMTFPDREFPYRIGLDHITSRFDYFIDLERKQVIGFVAEGDDLKLFKTSGEVDQIVDKTPFLTLHRTSGAPGR